MLANSVSESKNRVAIYCRLSSEDGNEISQSISSQKEILSNYVTNHGWKIVDIYADDGFSGTNFNRPDFERMLNDIENGKIDIVITKDLSRLGRNYIQTGMFTEEYFPSHNIRYIALNDNYDSIKGEGNDFAPFKNIINEWYAKDISKKIRFTLENQAKKGIMKRTPVPTFGYTFGEKNERVPDSETAPIVQMIFKKFVETGSITAIMNMLKEKKIKVPAYYNAIKYGVNKDKILSLPEEKLITWQRDTIACIIRNEAYIGTLKTQLTKSRNYKDKRRFRNKDCYVFENRFEPIIDKETFEIANRLKRRTRTGNIPYDENLFKGLIYCADCHSLMRYKRIIHKKTNTYRGKYCCDEKTCKYSNDIPKKVLIEVCKKEFGELKDIILKNKEKFLEIAQNKENNGRELKLDSEKDLIKLKGKCSEIDSFMQKTVEQYAKGVIPEVTFETIMKKYTREKELISEEIKRLEMKIDSEKKSNEVVSYATSLINTLENFSKDDEITAQLAHKLIKQINVHAESINRCVWNRKYDIEIVYANCDEIIKEFIGSEQ